MTLRRVEKVALLAIAVSIVLVVLKYALARISGSVALVADAWHSLADVLISCLVLASAWVSRKQWKHAAFIENIIALIVSFIILGGGFMVVMKSLGPKGPDQIRYLPLVLVGTVISAAISRIIGLYEIKVGKQENSPSMVADGQHSIMDVYSTAVVAVGLLGHMIGLKLDSIAAIIVVLFIVELALEVSVMAIKGLIKHQPFTAHEHERSESGIHRFAPAFRGFISRITNGRIALAWKSIVLWYRQHRGPVTGGAVGLVLLLYLLSGFFTVAPHQSAIVTIFGKAGEPKGAGLHYALPFPVGKTYRVDTSMIHVVELGFRSTVDKKRKNAPLPRSAYEWHSLHLTGIYKKQKSEAIMLTGDENIIDVNAVLKYTVSDPGEYLFGFENRDAMLRALSENVLRTIISVMPIDAVLTGDRKNMEERATQLLQKETDKVGAGIVVQSIELQDVHPPVEVVRAFREVASAKEDKSLLINEAVADRNERIPNARAQAAENMFEAEAYLLRKKNEAEGEGTRFTGLATEYGKAKEVTWQRLYIQTMEYALAGKRKFIISPDLEPGALDLRVFARGQPQKSKGKTKNQ